uniref:Meiotic nuclear division protein 1 homolog n=1 Tax=Strigamia maritima TaxID=126957 RepID=T1JNR4_STRMM
MKNKSKRYKFILLHSNPYAFVCAASVISCPIIVLVLDFEPTSNSYFMTKETTLRNSGFEGQRVKIRQRSRDFHGRTYDVAHALTSIFERGFRDKMSKKRGLSLEEKRQRLIDLFYEKNDFYQLKELEKIASKEKGIVLQSVKEVLQGLVDDNLVDSEKIGTSIYFWSFSSKAVNNRKRKLEDLTGKTDETTKKIKLKEDLIKNLENGRGNMENRDEKIKELEVVKKEHEILTSEVGKYKDCDPDFYKGMAEESVVAKSAANRWTDNIFCVKSWCKNKFGMEEKNLNQAFEIPEDLDYIE